MTRDRLIRMWSCAMRNWQINDDARAHIEWVLGKEYDYARP